MTDNNHPITPPPELVVEWADTIYQQTECDDQRDLYVAIQAARWGADQELEACCAWLETGPYGFSIEATAPSMTKRLRAARRLKPPSLKEQALDAWIRLRNEASCEKVDGDLDCVLRALESLPD